MSDVAITRRALLACLFLAACASPPARREPTIDHSPLNLAVGAVVAGEGPPPLPLANFIDERRSRELADALRGRLVQRLIAAGGPSTLRFDLEQVALTERLVESRVGGIGGLMSREPTYAFEGAIAVRLRLIDATGREAANVRAAVERTRSMPAGSSVAAREKAARELAADLLEQFERALETAVREQLAPWVL